MTISTTISKIQYTCNGTTDTYPYTFKILASSDLYVVYTDLSNEDHTWTEDTEYTVTNVGEESGGNVVIEESYLPTSGTLLTIYRDVPLTQETDYVENDPFHADTLETDFDRTIMIIQQLDEEINRCIRTPISDEGASSLIIPSTTERIEKLLGFDENGDFEVVDRNIAYQLTTANITDFTSAVTTLTNNGSVDHGHLGGLTDDDHTQYHNNTRGDSRYYTQSQITVISGDIVAQIPDVSNFITDAEVATISGDIVAQIPDVSDFITDDEVDTISGAIVAQIPTLASGTITSTMLKTANGSVTGSINPTFTAYIALQVHSFFPQIYSSVQCTIENGTTSAVDYVGRFSIYNSSGSTANYAISFKYVTSSDKPFIYAVRDKSSGDILYCWMSEDPPHGYWGLSQTPENFVPPIVILDGDKKPILDLLKHEELVSWKVDKGVFNDLIHRLDNIGGDIKKPHEVLKSDYEFDKTNNVWKAKKTPPLPKKKGV